MGGIICEATVDKDDQYKDRLKRIKLTTLDGKEFELDKTYDVVTNSYLASVCKPFLNKDYESLHIHTADMLINYLKKLKVSEETESCKSYEKRQAESQGRVTLPSTLAVAPA